MNKGTYILRNPQACEVVRTQIFDIDAGAGQTTDDVIFSNLPYAVDLVSAQAVYTEATDTTGAATANWKLGVAAGGATIVAQTAYVAAKAVGSTSAGTILIERIAAGATLFCRHTARAATESGKAYVQVVYRIVA